MFNTEVFAQNCGKTRLCSDEYYGDYDYRSQSSSAVLAPGDTARTSIVIYVNTDVRILVCCDEILGDVEYKIVYPVRKMREVIDQIIKNEKEVEVYKKDQDGNFVVEIDDWSGEPLQDEYGDPLYVIERWDKVVTYDTTYKVEEYDEEEIIFDSRKTDKPFWQSVVKSTRRLVVEVVVPQNAEAFDDYGNATIEGCVNVGIGRKSSKKKGSFKRN